MRNAFRRLTERSLAARTNPGMWSDVAYGLGLLRESGVVTRDRRVELLNDLQVRALTAESTHDPSVINDLIQAVITFLEEELAQAIRARAADAVDTLAAQKREAPTMQTTGNVNTQEARRARAEQDGYRKYAAAALREVKRRAERRRAAAAAIGAAGATRYVTPDELADFGEAQWPALIERWTAAATGKPYVPTDDRAAAPANAVAVFEQSFLEGEPRPGETAVRLFDRLMEIGR